MIPENPAMKPAVTSDIAQPAQLTPPFADFSHSLIQQTPLRQLITKAYCCPEAEAVQQLLAQAKIPDERAMGVHRLALKLATTLRQQKSLGGRAGIVQGLLQEYALTSQEGVALMCLAEALLRIPDKQTRNALIRDKICHDNWQSHLGKSQSVFVNAATWGLLLTGKLVATHSEQNLSTSLTRLLGKGGEPLIRKGLDMAMRMMGEQFVTGETIDQALKNTLRCEAKGFRYSYDMLGEAALTEQDAQRYLASYQHAIHAIGDVAQGRGIYAGPGISIKLSALHPRYSRGQYQRVMTELYPRLLQLTLQAKQYDIGINIDAEEADRLEISLDLLERLCLEPKLSGWNGIGFVIQSYQKRCPYVIDYLIELAQRSQHRLMIRLVKGAYWDSEIKHAQVEGMTDYPLYTRKMYTDISYLACAQKLLAAPAEIYPQFATHNAHTLAAIYHLAGKEYHPEQYEFQCLHGMGEPLYEQVIGEVAEGKLGRPCRIYAPVGTHTTLLSYLVRRLLENGANTSFVNQIADHSIPVEDLVADPVNSAELLAAKEGMVGRPHPAIPLPASLYGAERANSHGIDLSNELQLAQLAKTLSQSGKRALHIKPMLGCAVEEGEVNEVLNPADRHDQLGTIQHASLVDVENALHCAQHAVHDWQKKLPAERAALLEHAADLMQGQLMPLMGTLVREAGKTFANAMAEVREAVDFLRYYASQVRQDFNNETFTALGPVVCISPWNFPLAIFSGQIAAALAAGNCVLAKPAEQTSLVAGQAVQILLQAGIPAGVIQFLPGEGSVIGARLVEDHRVKGVMFTGSTEVAHLLQAKMAGRLDAFGRPIPLIAETGGLNAMIVDSSALTEQAVADIITSAFDSAGQRCSALRLLCVQEESADRVIRMLKGAMAECRLGRTDYLHVDIGPVIDKPAQQGIEQHIHAMAQQGKKIYQGASYHQAELDRGSYVLPTLIELDQVDELQREIFGPVLHIVRYRRADLDNLINRINGSGYGLTLGLHTRIDETINNVVDHTRVGNVYVNRNMVGAVVGVQPFGGEGLSGTGPKAGGPLYLYRLLARRPDDALMATLQRLKPQGVPITTGYAMHPLLAELRQWANSHDHVWLSQLCQRYAAQNCSGKRYLLAGPTGEQNSYRLLPRNRILCLADTEQDYLCQLAALLAIGCKQTLWLNEPQALALWQKLPGTIQQNVVRLANRSQTTTLIANEFTAVLFHGLQDRLEEVCSTVAEREGAIVNVHAYAPGTTDIMLERLLLERAVSINTAATGGNASLMSIG